MLNGLGADHLEKPFHPAWPRGQLEKGMFLFIHQQAARKNASGFLVRYSG